MTASVFDSLMFAKLFPVGEAGRLFTHSSEIRAALLVLGTLAKVQAEAGDIPEDSGFFIHRSAMEVQIDPAGLADGLEQDGSYVPALAAAFAKAMEAPEHSQFILHNTAAQHIADTGLMLRLRQLLSQIESGLQAFAQQDRVTFARAALPALREFSLHAAFAPDSVTGGRVANALKLGAPKDARASVRAISNWLASVAEAVAPDSPKAIALCQTVLANNSLLQKTETNADAKILEQLCLPHIALGTVSLLQGVERA